MQTRRVLGALVAAVIIAAAFLALPGAARADLIPSAPVVEGGSPAGDETRGQAVAQGLRAAGLSEAEVAARLATMGPHDLAVAADNPDQIQVAGGDYSAGAFSWTLVIVGVVLVTAIVVGLLI